MLLRNVEKEVLEEGVHGVQRGGHVGPFGHALATIGQQNLGVGQVEFVLRGAGESGKAGNGPHGVTEIGRAHV